MLKTSLEDLSIRFEQFKNQTGHYPSGSEITQSELFPINVKTIDRNFGGMRNLRRLLGLEITDLRKGKTRSEKIEKNIMKNYEDNTEIYNQLCSIFQVPFVHKQSPNLKVFCANNQSFCIDIFNASNKESLIGCINFKLKKLEKIKEKTYLISMNKNITQENLQYFSDKRKNKIPENIQLVTLDKFTELLATYKPIVIQ